MIKTESKKADKKTFSVDSATHEAYTGLRDKYNFNGHKALLKKIYLVLNHLKIDLSLPVKDIVPGTGKEFHLGQKDLKKLLEEQKLSIRDLFIQHHRTEREQAFLQHQIDLFNKFIQAYVNNSNKDKEITRLNEKIEKYEIELKKFRGDS